LSRSFTSEQPFLRRKWFAGTIGVVHPFPSALDAVAAVTIALIAGAGVGLAIRLGLGMLCLQFAIGAANDFADATSDGLSRQDKPIPAGFLSLRAAAGISLVAAGLGLLVAASVGVAVLAVGVVGLADGLMYDFRLKGTPLAWVLFAAGVGLLPLYAWLGARGTVPAAFAAVVTMAVIAGATLALSNAYVDVARDRQSGVVSVATYLGMRRTLFVNAALLASIQVVVVVSTLAIAGATPLLVVEGCGCGFGWVGLGLAAARSYQARALLWEAQAVGIMVFGTAWLAVLNSAGLLRG
jgi:4-hydroxybenzoate polyprenyltransferase